MGLLLNGTDQCLTAPVNITAPQPFTLLSWVQRPSGSYGTQNVINIADSSETLAYIATQCRDDKTRALSFSAYAEAASASLVNDGSPHCLIARFNGSTLSILFDDETIVSTAWSPSGSVAYDLIAIGRNANSVASEYFGGSNCYIEHSAAWDMYLSDEECAALFALTTSPADMETSNRLFYFPFIDSLTVSGGR